MEVFKNNIDTIQSGNLRIGIVPEFGFNNSHKPYLLDID
jgi:hypothetical protein